MEHAFQAARLLPDASNGPWVEMDSSFVHALAEAMLIVDPTGVIQDVNAEAERHLRVPVRPGDSAQQLAEALGLSPEQLASFLERASEVRAFTAVRIPAELETDDRAELIVEGARLADDSSSLLLRVRPADSQSKLHVLTDKISELKREASLRRAVETRLSHTQLRYHTLFNGINDAVYVYHLNEDGTPSALIEVNDAAVEILGYSREELRQMRPNDVTDPDRVDLRAKLDVLSRDGRMVTDSCHVTKGGKRIPVEVSAHLFDFDGRPTVLSICRDISERKRVERQLAETFQREHQARQQAEASREQLAFIVQATGILATDLNYERTLQDLADLLVPYLADWCAVTMVGEDAELQQIAVAHHDRSKVESVLAISKEYPTARDAEVGVAHVIRTGEPELFEDIPQSLIEEQTQDERHLALIRQLGLRSALTVPIMVRDEAIGAIALIYAESGRNYSRHDLLFAQELAARAGREIDNARLFRAVELARDKAEEMNRLKSAFLANMSHEIRTPLTSILGFASLLEKRVASEHRQLVEHIRTGGKRLLDTLDAVLSLSQLESQMKEFELAPVDINALVEEVTTIIKSRADEKGLAINTHLTEESAFAIADSGAVTSVLQNLIGNAIKFTSEGGVDIRVMRERDSIRIEVADSGVGMNAEYLEHLFEPFYQESSGWNRNFEGAGLGLAITKRLIDGMRGSIDVATEKYEGSRFTVTLEAADPPQGEEDTMRTSETERITHPSPHILLVEDNVESGMFMEALLSDFGQVTLATNAEEAITAAERAQEGFDVLILDINLGNGRTGTDVLRHLRSRVPYKEIPAAAVTAYALPGDRERLLQEGFSDYLSKPFSPDDLTSLVERLLADNERLNPRA